MIFLYERKIDDKRLENCLGIIGIFWVRRNSRLID